MRHDVNRINARATFQHFANLQQAITACGQVIDFNGHIIRDARRRFRNQFICILNATVDEDDLQIVRHRRIRNGGTRHRTNRFQQLFASNIALQFSPVEIQLGAFTKRR